MLNFYIKPKYWNARHVKYLNTTPEGLFPCVQIFPRAWGLVSCRLLPHLRLKKRERD